MAIPIDKQDVLMAARRAIRFYTNSAFKNSDTVCALLYNQHPSSTSNLSALSALRFIKIRFDPTIQKKKRKKGIRVYGSEVCNVGVQRNKKIIHFTSRLYEIMLILRV